MANDFISQVMSQTEELESPRQFFYWSALASISAVLKNRVYLDRYAYTLYPNIYVMLFAKSGLRKGVPINLAKKLVQKVDNTRVIVGRSSIQAIIKELATTRAKQDGSILKDAAGFIIASEFAASLVKDPQSLTILTDLYDSNYNEEWHNMLKGSNLETLKNVSLTMLGGINHAHFQDTVDMAAIMGGFIGRTFIVYEEKKANINSLVSPPKRTPNFDELAGTLKGISRLSGAYKFSSDGARLYDEWYRKYNEHSRDDKTGTSERISDSILKVAMLLSASRRDDLLLDVPEIQEAIDECLTASASVKRTTVGVGKAQSTQNVGLVLQELLSNKEITRKQLLSRHYSDFDAFELDRIIETLEQAGACVSKKHGSDISYRATERLIAEYSNIKEGGRG